MKKLLLSSLMLAAGIFAASAAEATIDFSQQGWSNESEITATTPIGDSGISVAFAKGEGKSAPKYYNSGTAVRMYSGNTMTLAVPQGTTVTSIAMKLSSQTYNFADDNTGYPLLPALSPPILRQPGQAHGQALPPKTLFSPLSTSKTPQKNGRSSASFL